ncbi:hypothetical protein UPYG_G00243310 [Umbra pygmaea]|uniref:Uncharacterized protein n=1 Tax=Umbra pygmaea TaxID=75934 RepID=A0ABD0WFS3_UMBPY
MHSQHLLIVIIVGSGTLLYLGKLNSDQNDRNAFINSVQKSLKCRNLRERLLTMSTMKTVDIALFTQGVSELMDCPWRLNLTHRELQRTELWACCNASDKLMVTRQNTNLHQSLIYEAERSNKKLVDQSLWEMLPKSLRWNKKGLLGRCAVVGSGGILNNSSCGEEIDSADYVIRFGLAPINQTVDRYGIDVGIKTDLVSANPSQILNGYRDLQKNPGPLTERLSVYGHAQLYHALHNGRPQNEVVFLHPDYLFDLARFWHNHEEKIKRLSTGLILTSAAMEICEEVHLYGFWPFALDLSQNPVSHHYYDNVGSTAFHSMPEEFLLLLKLHTKGTLQLHLGHC